MVRRNQRPRFTQDLDVGDNQLPGMHALAELPVLRTLKMQCNCLASLQLEPGSFVALESLELSYNSLGPDALLQLATLPNLRELDISFNCVTRRAPLAPRPE